MEDAAVAINELADNVTNVQFIGIRIGVAAVLTLVALFGGRLVRAIFDLFGRHLRPRLPKWLSLLIHGFARPLELLIRAALLYGALLAAPLPAAWTEAIWHWLTPVVKAGAVMLAAWGFWRSAPLCRQLLRSAENSLDVHTSQTMGRFFENVYRVVVLVFAVLVVLDIFGVPVVSLVAGAGIAGLAISLAAQSTLTNLIAGITLVLEHPFGIGDYVVLGAWEGTVEDISFRSTRLRTPDNVVITVENSKVCGEYIQNTTLRDSRLINQTLRLPNDTPPERVEALCAAIRRMLEEDPEVKDEPVTVTVDAVGDDGIKIFIRAYGLTPDYLPYLKLKDRLNREILRLAEREGCRFSYQPVSVYGEKE